MKKNYWKAAALGGSIFSLAVLNVPTVFAANSSMMGVGNINQLNQNFVVSSTVDPTNGDNNPYAVVVDNRPGSTTYGEIFVSNFSNKAGTNGAGTTIERIVAGKPVPFVTNANGPAAMAFSPKGPLWIANFGQNGTDGNVQVTKPNGTSFGQGGWITNPVLKGPWGQAFAPAYTTSNGSTVPAAFFATGAQNGTVVAMFGFSPPDFQTTTHFIVLGSGLAKSGWGANNIEGPQGMAYDTMTHTLYVTDTADNSIRAFQWDGTASKNQGMGKLVYQNGLLNKPAGLTIDPVNGDLLVVNQGNNDLIQLRILPNGKAQPVAKVVLDKTPVNPKTGAGSALFGIAASKDASGNLVVYYTDDNSNTVNELDYQPSIQITGKMQMMMQVNQQTVETPYVYQTQAMDMGKSEWYVPVYYLQQALHAMNFSSTWNGSTLNISTSSQMSSMMSKDIPSSLGDPLTSATLMVNGTYAGIVRKMVESDPYTGKPTTYVCLSDLTSVLENAGISLQLSNDSLNLSMSH